MDKKSSNNRASVEVTGAHAAPDWSRALVHTVGHPPVLPLVCQDLHTGQVLMVGYVSEDAWAQTLASGEVVFWSRSQGKLWKKGETSGHTLRVRRLLVDCDADTLLALVEPQGPTCHRNSTTCFDRESAHGEFAVVDVGWSPVARLYSTLRARAGGEDTASYTYKLLQAGPDRVLRKLGEECTEAILAAKNSTITGDAREFVSESADLLYHWLVALIALKVSPERVLDELKSREGGPRRGVVDKV